MTGGTVLALSGGVGGAKLALGLAHVLPAGELVFVANTGDDFEHLGLHISPDIDTLLYTLAGLSNPTLGWGREQETWSCMAELERLGGETWFRLGDKDLAMHLYRTARLSRGARLTEVTDELRRSLQVGPLVLPMTDDPVRTFLVTDRGRMAFQDYFVRARCDPKVEAVFYEGAADATASTHFSELLRGNDLHAIIVCPSNPYLSIGPILAIPHVRDGIEQARSPVVVVSPIVAGTALKGPTAKLMEELGIPASALAVAEHYRGLIDGFVLDQIDSPHAKSIETMGIRCLVTNTVMRTLDDRKQLARDILGFVGTMKL